MDSSCHHSLCRFWFLRVAKFRRKIFYKKNFTCQWIFLEINFFPNFVKQWNVSFFPQTLLNVYTGTGSVLTVWCARTATGARAAPSRHSCAGTTGTASGEGGGVEPEPHHSACTDTGDLIHSIFLVCINVYVALEAVLKKHANKNTKN